MKRNYLHTVVWVTLSLVSILLVMRWIPSVEYGDWQSRRVDILSDVIVQNKVPDSLPDAAVVTPPQIVDSCPPGVTCIMDFANDSAQGMEPLYKALCMVNSLGRPVRIAVLGDSYIEGDIVTAKFRELMQKRFGGSGVGYVPITSDSPGFRHTVAQTFANWEDHNANDNSGYNSQWANITGHYFFAKSKAWVELRGVKEFLARLDTCTRSSIYFSANTHTTIVAGINGGEPHYFSAEPAPGVAVLSVSGRIGRARWDVPQPDNTTFYGVSLDCDRGVIVDNFGLRSASGYHLSAVSDSLITAFDRARHYDLVVFAYGLNVAGKNQTNFSGYYSKMTAIISRYKQLLPHTGFLVMSVADREGRDANGNFKTYSGVHHIVATQQRIAADCHVAFWNLYEAMGGEGSVVKMAQNHEANLDYTHVNHKGGKRLGELLFNAIAWGQECYEKSHPKQQ